MSKCHCILIGVLRPCGCFVGCAAYNLFHIDTDELNGFVDIFDRQLYMEAVALFERDVERFGLAHEYCQELSQGRSMDRHLESQRI